MSQQDFADMLQTSKQVISRYELGHTTPKIGVAARWCKILNINLDNMLNDTKGVYDTSDDHILPFPAPNITEDVVTFPVIGTVAAGYDEIAMEDWSGDTVEIPTAYLHGRPRTDYFVLSVHGDSMYPMYLDGDKVLVLKTDTLDRSGQVGIIMYNGDEATLKKIEYVEGEDWLRMVPLNPLYPPRTIEGADLERCRVIGIPKLLIREIEL
jgi:SOS-response transcriptional repressor LexA